MTEAEPSTPRIAAVRIGEQQFLPAELVAETADALVEATDENERLRAELAAWQAAHAERGQQLDDARALLGELAAAVEGHCDVDHGTSGCPFEVLDRVKRETHLG